MSHSSLSGSVVLLHVCPLAVVRPILLSGLDPAFSRSAWHVVWLGAVCRRTWAIAHVLERHCCPAVCVLRVRVPRAWVQRRARGVWVCRRFIHASCIISVSLPIEGGVAAAA